MTSQFDPETAGNNEEIEKYLPSTLVVLETLTLSP